jgi:hypothetical protein
MALCLTVIVHDRGARLLPCPPHTAWRGSAPLPTTHSMARQQHVRSPSFFLFLFLLLYSFALRAHNVRVRGVPLCTITTRLQLQYAYRSLPHPQRDDVVLVC